MSTVIRLRWLAAALPLWGCEPGVGSSCDPDEARCLNASTQLVCEAGKYIATPCRGPGGCAVLPSVGVACDITKNQPGDQCAVSEEGVASCVSDHRMIVCRGQKYRFEPCRGPDGCENSSGRARCDKTLASVGDPCLPEIDQACDVKGRELLGCQAGKLVVKYSCRGPDGCRVKDKLSCDMSVADKGDRCDQQMQGASACTPDKTGIVTCVDGKFVKDEDCKPGEECSPGGATRCAKAGSESG